MVAAREAPSSTVVGREAELAMVAATLDRASRGESGTVLVFGEVGVGKTALVQRAVVGADASALRLTCACLPLQTISVPLAPLRAAARGLRGPPGLPPWPLDGSAAVDQAPAMLDAWLQMAADSTPVVMVVDDLQWADASTLDVLMYLVAGPADRRFALLGTVRSQSAPDGHPFHRWLADALRLPRVGQLHLEPLDRAGTEAQLASLLGTAPHQTLVDDVFRHTLGNPYLNRLVTAGLAPTARRLPSDLPTDLQVAVRRSWHALSPHARDVTSLLAVGGRPQHRQLLEAVAADLGLAEVESALEEAEEAGLLVSADGERYWFGHPLQAQVLEQSLTAGRRRSWHAAYARHGETALASGTPLTFEIAAALTDHHDQAGHVRAAYAWALRSQEIGRTIRGSPEPLQLMQRAIELRALLPDAAESVRDLLWRLRHAADAVGSARDELAAVDALIDVTDRVREPLVVSELLVRRMLLRMAAGAGFAEVDDVHAAAELAAVAPTSWQYALAMAELAHTGMWVRDTDTPRHASIALAAARESGDPRALCYALTAASIVATDDLRPAEGAALAAEAVTHALAARDWWGFVHASMWEAIANLTPASRQHAEHYRRRGEQLAAAGAPHSYCAQLGAVEAWSWLMVGNWQAAQDLLRTTLASDPGPFADIMTRLTAALAAGWQDRPAEAAAHLERARELVSGDEHRYVNFPFDAVRSLVFTEAGDPEAAYRAAMSGLSSPELQLPDQCEFLVPLASRALADLAEAARDAGVADSAPLADLESLVRRFPDIVTDPGQPTPQMIIQRSAMSAWYAAEIGRARQTPGSAERWLRTAALFEEGQLPWPAVYAWRRAAEALLSGGRQRRAEGVAALRTGWGLACELRAGAVQRELEALGRSARVALGSRPAHDSAPALVPGLTAREREILAHLVTGATYAEIADALVISEKTVSSHVSNLLRKTQTSNRVELSRLAQRIEHAGGGT